MIVTSWTAWLGFFLIFALSSFCGCVFSRRMPWSRAAQTAGLPWSVGLGLGPLIIGIITVCALWFLPGAAHATHLWVVALTLIALSLLAFQWRKQDWLPEPAAPGIFGEGIAIFFIACWIMALLINTLFLPLTQNDPLEYATVGRILFESRDLAAYPAIHPELTASGFYGPWTHPPLYVALIYLTYVLQGTAEMPGLMCMIAPWCVLVGAYIIFSLGQLVRNRLTGLWAVLIFISTPMLFIGGHSAMIDSLPALGLALIIAFILGLDASIKMRGVLIGFALGCALWTHSQAILFIPLALAAVAMHQGLRNWRSASVECIIIVGAALAVGAWPYIRNMLIFGSPVSDNPTITAMPEIAWSEYLEYTRGFDNVTSMIQYGIFKGWFSFRYHGIAYWLMSIGIGLFVFKLGYSRLRQSVIAGASTLEAQWRYLCICIVIVAVYHVGVALSVFLGIDLMIKNERYLLAIIPAVAVIAGFGTAHTLEYFISLFSKPSFSRGKRELFFVGSIAMMLVLLGYIYVIGFRYQWNKIPSREEMLKAIVEANDKTDQSSRSRFDLLLDTMANFHLMNVLDQDIPSDGLVLSLRPADMYYSHRKMISYIDPRLVPVYQEKDPEKAVRILQDLGVRYIQSPEYDLPVTYNTALKDVMSRPDLTTLLYSRGMYQLYELKPSGKRVGKEIDFSPGHYPWYRWYRIGGGGKRFHLSSDGEVMTESKPLAISSTLQLWHRDFSAVQALGTGSDFINNETKNMLPVQENQEYLLTLDIKGKGYMRVWELEVKSKDQEALNSSSPTKINKMGEIVLTHPENTYRYTRRFITKPNTVFLRLGVEQMGYSTLQIERAVLQPIQ